VALCGPIWSYVVLCGPMWSYVVLCGFMWSYVVLCGPMSPYVVLYDLIPWDRTYFSILHSTQSMKYESDINVNKKMIPKINCLIECQNL